MNRRSFLGLGLAATGGIFVPQFGKWYRQGSGLLVPSTRVIATAYVPNLVFSRDAYKWAARPVAAHGDLPSVADPVTGITLVMTVVHP